MTDLTEQWKKGELPEGWYYVKGSRAEGIYAYTAEYLNNVYRPRNGERIIEQVPSYDEWQAKLEENAQLKELLRIILSKTETCYSMVLQKDIITAELNKTLLKKIDEALK